MRIRTIYRQPKSIHLHRGTSGTQGRVERTYILHRIMAPPISTSILPIPLFLTLPLLLTSPSDGLRFKAPSSSSSSSSSSLSSRTRTCARMDMYSRPRTWAPWQQKGTEGLDKRIVPIDEIPNGDRKVVVGIAPMPAAMMADDATSPREPNLRAYWTLLRIQNVPSSFGLVAAGALVASHSMQSLLDPKVIFTAVAAAAISVGSCVLNDWFDIELDRVNKPNRPLVTGEVMPHHALIMGLTFLSVALVSASAVHPAALQATIIASVALTSAYTPLLKPLPLVKNFVVAAVIAGAISSGGLAAGAGLAATLAPTCLTFFVIAHREILMDITDIEGDSSSGIRTLPVLLGREKSLALALMLLTAGVGCALLAIMSSATSTTGARTLAAALCGLFTSPLYNNIARVRGAEFSPDSLSTAVEQALGPLALVLGLMGFALR